MIGSQAEKITVRVKADELLESRNKAIAEAEKAAHEYAAYLEVGDERTMAFLVFENVRKAQRVYSQPQ